MKISYNWLKDYIDIDVSPEELSEILTSCGLEVEELEYRESVKGGLKGIVIGQVAEVRKHPNADKLSITQVDVAGEKILQIVCGAPNVAVGQKVLVATVGTTLYNSDEPWQIKNAKIRGEESFGMICAEDELGLGTSHDGIMVLPNDAPVGMAAAEYFHIQKDFVYTIGLTPNRVDASSHIGVARDVAAVINTSKNSQIKVKMPVIEDIQADTHLLPVEIVVDDNEACPRYSGLTVSNLAIGPSPSWMTERLIAAGMRPVNNVVDITNYVMLEIGQPLHAFDMKHVKGHKIVVKKYNNEREFITLDEVKRTISTDDLMICNDSEPMCIAGVFGGLNSGVTENTSEIFLESAYFHPVSVRKTSNKHALKTESSFRFERGADPTVTVVALKRAASLLQKLAGGVVSSPVYDVYPVPIPASEICINFGVINKCIGHSIDSQLQLSILRDLDFEIVSSDNEGAVVKAPHAKVDVTRPADVLEEILRVYGYNNIPFPENHRTCLSDARKPDVHAIKNVLSEMLVANGFFEIMTNSLSAAKYYTPDFGFDEKNNVVLLNPLSNELNTMRRSLVFSGLESVAHNINRKQSNVNFFEFGKVYKKGTNKESGSVSERYEEQMQLLLMMSGEVFPLNWKYQSEGMSFYHLKNKVHQLFNRMGISERLFEIEEIDSPLYTYGLKYSLKGDKNCVVRMGELSQMPLDITECRQAVFCAEIMWDQVIGILTNNTVKSTEIPRFPEVHRDIAMLLDKTVKYDSIQSIVSENGGKLIKLVRLFDVYEGKNIPEGKKSYAINIVLQDMEKTLTDNETDSIMDAIRKAVVEKLGAIIR
jgi:phenylalanyl-tRNA synthetase beta chain